ncbi:MAG: DUF2304 domain-containing protein [bacterium]|nr:DUF2304 domain-containing protein [bacterium]
MNILGVQILALLFAVFMVYVAFLHWKRKDINSLEVIFWSLLWLVFIVVTLFPKILQSATQLLFIARVMDLVMLTAFMILAFLGFQNHVANRKMEKRIEEFIRKEALGQLEKKDK